MRDLFRNNRVKAALCSSKRDETRTVYDTGHCRAARDSRDDGVAKTRERSKTLAIHYFPARCSLPSDHGTSISSGRSPGISSNAIEIEPRGESSSTSDIPSGRIIEIEAVVVWTILLEIHGIEQEREAALQLRF